MVNIGFLNVDPLRLFLIPIISYFLCVYILKPVFNLVYMVIYYHAFPSCPKHFLLGHLKTIWPNFPFQSDINSVPRKVYEIVKRTVDYNPERSVSVFWVSLYPLIVTSDYEAVEMVLDKKNLKKPFFYKFTGLGDGLIGLEPESWRFRRKLIEPFFSTKKLKGHAKTIYTVVESFSQQLNNKVGEIIDLEPQIHRSTLDIILKSAASIPFDDLIVDKKMFLEAISNLEPNAVRRGTNPLYYFDWLFKFFEFGQFYFETLNIVNKCNKVIVNRRNELLKSSKFNESDFLHLLESKVDDQALQEELKTLISAGHETTAVGLLWILFNLGNHSDAQEKLYQEIIENFPDETPIDDVDKINKCNYLDQCLKESLRLNPPIHWVARLLDDDVWVNGKRLLKGSNVALLIDTTHRDPSVYPDPEKYDPDRWNPENVSKIPKEAFIPFGYGPRVCVGWRYAMLELKIYTISIVRKFSIKSVRKHGSIPCKSEITLKPVLPLEVILTPRTTTASIQVALT